MNLNTYVDQKTLNQRFSEQIAAILNQAVKEKNEAFLVVSGGKTPLDLFKNLATIDIDWSRVTIILADERIVDVQSPESNEFWVKACLIQDKAASANFISLRPQSIGSLKNIEQTIASIPAFDVLILGMGDDGHTASLFPCCPELGTALSDKHQAAVMLTNPVNAPHRRVTMTKKRLFDSLNTFVHITGERKKEVLQQALTICDPIRMPICAFLDQPELQVMYAP